MEANGDFYFYQNLQLVFFLNTAVLPKWKENLSCVGILLCIIMII